MKVVETRGRFWLPSTPSRKVSGLLVFDGKNIRLELDRPLVELQPQGSGRLFTAARTPLEASEIWAETSAGDATILSCWWHPAAWPEDLALGVETAHGQMVLWHHHLRGNCEFASVQLETEGLDGWVDLCRTRVRHFEIADAEVLSLIGGRDELFGLGFGSNWLSLSRGGYGTYSDQRVSVERHSYFDVRLRPFQTIEHVLADWVSPLRSLVAIASCEASLLTRVSLRFRDQSARSKAVELTFAQLGGPQEELSPTKPNQAMNSLALPSIDDGVMAGLIRTWVRDWRGLSAVSGPLLAERGRERSFVEDRISSAAVAVEAAYDYFGAPTRELSRADHRGRVEAIEKALTRDNVDSEIVQWAIRVLRSRNDASFRQKVEFVLDNSGPVGASVAEAIPDFAARFVGARGPSVHSGGEVQGEAFHHLAVVMRYLVGAALVLAGGYSVEGLRRFATTNGEFRHALSRLTHE